MRLRLVTILTVACCGVALSLWLVPPAAFAQESAGADKDKDKDKDKFSYVGSKACKKCHLKLYKSWEKTKSAKAFETLKPDQAAEAKTKHGLDPKKDYTQDKSCLKCHVTGFEEAGGYAIPDPTDKKAVKRAKNREGSGCESCHGPGSHYIAVFKELQKSKRKYKVDELYAVGLVKLGPSACTNCHNAKSPTYTEDKKLDYKRDKDKETHDHKPLKQREG